MLETIATEAAQRVLTAGLLGSLLVIVCVGSILLARFQYKECKAERAARVADQARFITVAEKMIQVMEETNRYGAERTRTVAVLSENIARQTDAFAALTSVNKLEFTRVRDLIVHRRRALPAVGDDE